MHQFSLTNYHAVQFTYIWSCRPTVAEISAFFQFIFLFPIFLCFVLVTERELTTLRRSYKQCVELLCYQVSSTTPVLAMYVWVIKSEVKLCNYSCFNLVNSPLSTQVILYFKHNVFHTLHIFYKNHLGGVESFL